MDEFRALLTSHSAKRGELARLASVTGLAASVIGRWRDGIVKPSPDNLRRLAPGLGRSYEDLLRMCGYLPGAVVGEQGDPEEARIIAAYRAVAPAEKPHASRAAVGALRAFASTNVHGGSNVRARTDRRPYSRPERQSVAA